MDNTPDRKSQGQKPPLPLQQSDAAGHSSQCQDSPVFTYLKNLSPIVQIMKPISYNHSATVPVVPTVFKSPQISTKKESKPMFRCPLSDLSKSESFCHVGDDKNQQAGNFLKTSDHISITQGNELLTYIHNQPIVRCSAKCPEPPNKQSECLPYNGGSPNHNNSSTYDTKSEFLMGSTSMMEIICDGSQENNQFLQLEGVVENEDIRDVQACTWADLLSDGNEDEYFGKCHQNASQQLSMEQTKEFVVKNEVDCSSHRLSVYEEKPMTAGSIEKVDDGMDACLVGSEKVISQQQRVMRRRCLTFETAGTRRLSNGSSTSLTSLSHQGQFTSRDGHETSSKPAAPLPCMISSIGLHLNTLTSAQKDLAQDALMSKEPINMSCSSSFPSMSIGEKDNPLPAEKDDPESDIKDLLLLQDFSHAPECDKIDDSNHNSPKKKRRRTENDSDGDSCKRCNCKKSKCLKLYCECFAAGVYCFNQCSCQGCFNKPENEDLVIETRKAIESRNPLAFAPKVIKASEPVTEIGEEANKTPASARHKRGCNCKKSNCLKKYCECYQGGVGCSFSCRCEGCKNRFGRKDGGTVEKADSEVAELDVHDEETKKTDTEQNANVQKGKQPSFDNLPMTPSITSRSCMKLPFHSSGKPPRSSTLIIGGSTSKLNASKSTVELGVPSKSQLQVLMKEDEPPEFLRSKSSPIGGVKIVSPSRKRISPPRNEGRASSPARKGCRKLILRSIPSLPPLTADSTDEPASS